MPRGGARPGAGRPRKVAATPASPTLRRSLSYIEAMETQILQRHRPLSVFPDFADDQLATITRDVRIGRHMFYVYGLFDPRNGRMFYVGKGQGPRAWSHSTATGPKASNARKVARVREILATGVEPEIRLLLMVPNERAALAIEELLIELVPDLTNIAHITKRARAHADMRWMKQSLDRMKRRQVRLQKLLREGDWSKVDPKIRQTIDEMAYEVLPKLIVPKLD